MMTSVLIVAVAGSIQCLLLAADPSKYGPFPNGIPGSGYGCNRDCAKGDLNYKLEARLETYMVPGSAKAVPGVWETDVSMFTRTFVGTDGPFCSLSTDDVTEYDGSSGPLGPCLQVNPGQTMTIQITNKLDKGMQMLNQTRPSLKDWWEVTQEPGLPHLDPHPYLDVAPTTPEGLIIHSNQSMPGWDVSFDDFNLHVHGMQVAPHLFFPQGTNYRKAPWITITPAKENEATQCFCYIFSVPKDHPQGTFFWHIHRHGSVAMQGWQGMLGVLQVGNRDSTGSPGNDLASQGITREAAFVIWEWGIDEHHHSGNHTYYEGEYVFMSHRFEKEGKMSIAMVNNEYQPNFNLSEQETMHLRVICGQTTTGSAFYILDTDDQLAPFYVFASDGISYDKAYKKKMIVIGPGQREGVLVQFEKKGTYRVMQGVIPDYQPDAGLKVGPGSDSPDLPIAFFEVMASKVTRVDLDSLAFTPGMGLDAIALTSLQHQASVSFDANANIAKAPLVQFLIDGQPFDFERITTTMPARDGAAWQLTSNMPYFHPFHIHVNPFQVHNFLSSNLPGDFLKESLVKTNMEPEKMWRDTVFIPPYGLVVIAQVFGGGEVAWQGKTVFHCHYLHHEDQGMMAAFMIGEPNSQSEIHV